MTQKICLLTLFICHVRLLSLFVAFLSCMSEGRLRKMTFWVVYIGLSTWMVRVDCIRNAWHLYGSMSLFKNQTMHIGTDAV